MNTSTRSILALFVVFFSFTTALAADNWPRFRGPDGRGVAADNPVGSKNSAEPQTPRIYGFNRLRSVNLDRTELRNCVGNVSAIVLIGTRQSSLASGLDYAALHFGQRQ
ncbi:hypothetical protein N9D38_09400 [Rubripirellula sp.]|nr:hypothetical protein [Rubripirellula sp.]